MVWINGQQRSQLPVSDRGLQFGDGCFTTSRVQDGRILWLEHHIARLRHDAQRLRFPAVDWQAMTAEMQLAAQGMAQGVVKAMLTRGSGGRGYSTAGCNSPTRIVMQASYPEHYAAWRAGGITLGVSPITLGHNVLLAGVKHLNRLEQVMIRQSMEEQQRDEVLVLDTVGHLVECCAANLFWRKGNQVFTPDLSLAGVNGVARQHLITQLAALPTYALHVVREPLSALSDADEIFICNALMPLVPVNHIHSWCYRSRALYQQLSPGMSSMLE